MKLAIIYCNKTASTQSGPGKSNWVLEYRNGVVNKQNPVMGWDAASDMLPSEVRMKFTTKQEAEQYAKRNNIAYKVIDTPHAYTSPVKKKPQSYLDIFTK